MADKYTNNNSSSDNGDYILRAANRVRDGINERADAYLEGLYDPVKPIKKYVIRGAAAGVLMLSLLTGMAFSGPADIAEDQEAANYKSAPIVMDVDDFVNTTVDDEEDDADEEKSRPGIVARFRQAVLSMPQSARILIGVPLWALGTALMTLVTYLWNILFATPVGAFIASFAVGFAVLTGLFTATAKLLFPDLPIRRILCKRNVIILMFTALGLSGLDAVAPLYWNNYPLAAAFVKLVLGGTVIGLLSYRTKVLFNRVKSAVRPAGAV
ncbi:MAG: hypothetical protein IJH95_00815 [Mogibacterium sp.]|nr:hypothetical protein [Mogibacterium sp.]